MKKFGGIIRRMRELMTRQQRLTFVVIVILTLIGTLFEVGAMAMVVPFVSLLQDAEAARAEWPVSVLADLFQPEDDNALIAAAGLAIVGVFLVKNAFLTGLVYYRSRFIFAIHNGVARALFSKYMARDYLGFISSNSAEMVRNLANGIDQLTAEFMLHSVRFGTDLILIVATFGLLLVADPEMGIVTSTTVALLVAVYQRLVSRQLGRDGRQRQSAVGSMIQQINEGLSSFKLAKLLGCEPHFITGYDRYNRRYTDARVRLTVLNEMPRYFIESFGLIAVVLAITLVVSLREDDGSMIPILALYSVGAFKLFPAMNRCLQALSRIQSNLPVLYLISDDLAAPDAHPSSRQVPADPGVRSGEAGRIVLDDVVFRYPGKAEPALDHVSLEIGRGQVVGLVGGSGAGKTTLVDVMMGLLPADSGDIRCDGRSIYADLRSWQRRVGYIPQSVFLIDSDIASNVAYGVDEAEIDPERVWHALEMAQLAEFVRALPEGPATRIGENGVFLSGGQRQRIGIARALYRDPEVIVMDEATASLDNQTEAGVMRAVLALGGQKTLIIVAHRMSTVQRCSQLFVLKRGAVVARGSYENLLETSPDFLEIAQSLDTEPA